ncbi:MAG: hypothetical protein AABX91_01200 [Nanoarchaeota archaeon]
MTNTMKNRKATLEVYFVPEGMTGRNESTWMMREDGVLVKQNIILSIWDTQKSEANSSAERGPVFYRVNFFDSLSLEKRVGEMTKKFKGTPSRNTNGYYDTASFEILRKMELTEYLDSLARKG